MHMVLHCVNFLPFWFNSVSWRFYVASTISFLVATWFSVVRIYHNLFNQSTVNGLLVCSHLLLVRNAVKYITLRYLKLHFHVVKNCSFLFFCDWSVHILCLFFYWVSGLFLIDF